MISSAVPYADPSAIPHIAAPAVSNTAMPVTPSSAADAAPFSATPPPVPPIASCHGASGGARHQGYYTPPYAAALSLPDYVAAVAPFYFAHLIPVKLTTDNYILWRAQVLPLLRSRYLEGYVDGTLPCPPPHHPAYHAWVAQDQAILSPLSLMGFHRWSSSLPPLERRGLLCTRASRLSSRRVLMPSAWSLGRPSFLTSASPTTLAR